VEAQKHIHEVMTGLSDTSAFESFDRMATRVEQLEAHASAAVEISQDLSGDTMEQRFRALESSTDVEQELNALKAKVQKELPPSS
jgi:phage shock protein A